MAAAFTRRAVLGGAAALAPPATRVWAQAAGPAPWLDIRAFGARLDGVTSDSAAIQRALDASGPTGRTVFVPAGRALLTDHDGDGACLSIRHAVRLVGEGALGAALVPARGLGAEVDVIVIEPDPRFAADFLLIERLALTDPSDGRRGGRHAIVARTAARGAALPRLTLRETHVGLGGGAAFAHRNDPAANPNGGLYGALIAECALRGAVVLDGSGDSNRVVGNIISGPGTGVEARLAAGAGMLTIADNNITSAAAGIDVSGDGVAVERNIVEHSSAGAGAAVVRVGTAGRRSAGCSVTRNTISAFGASRAEALVAAVDCDGIEVAGNLLLWGAADRAGVVIGPGCADARVGPNSRNANVRPARDGGLRTRQAAAADATIAR